MVWESDGMGNVIKIWEGPYSIAVAYEVLVVEDYGVLGNLWLALGYW